MASATDNLLELPPYGLPQETKTAALLAAVQEQIVHHAEHCPQYSRWLRCQGFDPRSPIRDLADVPFLPVGIFKRLYLASVPQSQVARADVPAAPRRRSPAASRSIGRRGTGR